MQLYSGMSENFVHEATHNQVAEKLRDSFFRHFRFNPSPSEVNSWHNSLRAMALVIQTAELRDHGIILEYQLPLTSKRLDCLVCGRNEGEKDSAVIVELKQWAKCGPSHGDNLVSTFLGSANRDTLHPSSQVRQYRRYLEDTHTAFYEDEPVSLSACAYLHNYFPSPDDELLSNKFKEVLSECPSFTGDNVNELSGFLHERLSKGQGYDVLSRIEDSEYRPSKKLMEHIANVIKGNPEYILLDEQFVVYESILAAAKDGFHDRRKTVILVRGGPGTGKSVIALNVMSDLLQNSINSQYATGSKAFTETLRTVIGSRGSVQFKYFNSYGQADLNQIDVLICDEAHRIRETSNSRFTPKAKKSNKLQIQELIDASKVSVFFIDDKQGVRPDEIGSSTFILDQARQNNCKIQEFQLEAQFRCAGSEGFVNWVNNTLGIEKTANVLYEMNDGFDFQILESPEELESAVLQKIDQGFTGRLTAGFCWQWSDPCNDGTLVEDVEIGGFRRPWNAKPDAKKLAKSIPKATHWAYDSRGSGQVGCVYTAQGFEFDYVGVIFGRDLRYDFESQDWMGFKEESFDRMVKRSEDAFTELTKNTYRILLSRGLKGCYVYFMDKATEQFVKSRLE